MALPWSTEPKPRGFRLEALASIAAGESARSVAARMGFDADNVPVWRRDGSLVAAAHAIGGPIKAEADARRKAAEDRRSAALAARRAQRDAHNAPVLAILREKNPHHARVCEYLLADHTLEEAARRFKFTRERARQIVSIAVHRHGLDTEGRFIGKAPVKSSPASTRQAFEQMKLARLMRQAA